MPPSFFKHDMPSVSAGNKTVTINIWTGQEFVAHANLLVHYSKYFRNALRSGMIESDACQFHEVEHATTHALTFFINWLYSRTWDENDIARWFNGVEHPDLLIETWLFADYIQASELQDNIVAILCRAYQSSLSETEKRIRDLVHPNISPRSGLHRLITKEIARGISHSSTTDEQREAWLQMLNPDAVIAVARHLGEHNAVLEKAKSEYPLNSASFLFAAKSHIDWNTPAEDFFEDNDDPTRRTSNTRTDSRFSDTLVDGGDCVLLRATHGFTGGDALPW